MSYDDTRTIVSTKIKDVEVSIEGGARNGNEDDNDYWSEDPSVWEYWVEAVKYNSKGEGTQIERKGYESGEWKKLVPIYKEMVEKYKKLKGVK